MARTKDAALSLEKKLAQALVPVEEQPYEVPENWCWCRISDVLHLQAGKNISAKLIILEQDPTHPYPCFGGNGIRGYVSTYNHDGNYPIIGRQGALCGNLNWASGLFYATEHAVVVTCSKVVFDRWAYYILSDMNLNQYATATAQPGLAVGNIEHLPLALSPLPEQHRIVDQIERLFAELDEAKERAQAVIDSYEGRKASILHRAFTGELTEEWRQNNNIPDSFWQTKPFNDVAEVKSNLVDPAGYMDYPHIAPDNIEKKTGILLDYHTVAEDGIKSGKHLFFAGQILYSKIRPYLSKVVIVDFDGLCSADMYPVQPKEGIDTRFLWYYMLSDEFLEQASTAGSRSVLPKINQKELGRIQVCVTDMTEQTEIVRILDSLLMKESAAKAAAEQAIDQIDTMKKSILARAFRGELGTNDPNDEPAIELLKRSLEARA